jgi:hypothetical protein
MVEVWSVSLPLPLPLPLSLSLWWWCGGRLSVPVPSIGHHERDH